MIDIVKILNKRYPKHKFSLKPDRNPVREIIHCDGRPLMLSWSPTAANELGKFKEINAADLLVTSVVELVGRVLNEEPVEDKKIDKQVVKKVKMGTRLTRKKMKEIQQKLIDELAKKELIKRGLI